MKKLFSLILFFSMTSILFAQNRVMEEQLMKDIQLPIHQAESFFEQNSDYFEIRESERLEWTKSVNGGTDHVHHKYQQYVENIPVFGGQVIVHSKKGQAIWSSGFWPVIEGISPQPYISRDQAIERSVAIYNQVHQDAIPMGSELQLKEADLYWVNQDYPKHTGDIHLAWRVTLREDSRHLHTQLMVDAHSGQFIFESPQIAHQGVPASGQTKYYGERSFICDSISADQYQLIDPTRSDGIYTFDENLQPWLNDSKEWDFTNEGNEVAIDLHWAMTEFYDMMLSRFGFPRLYA